MGLAKMLSNLLPKRLEPILRDQDLIRETSRLRLELTAAKQRSDARRADIDSLFDAMLRDAPP